MRPALSAGERSNVDAFDVEGPDRVEKKLVALASERYDEPESPRAIAGGCSVPGGPGCEAARAGAAGFGGSCGPICEVARLKENHLRPEEVEPTEATETGRSWPSGAACAGEAMRAGEVE